MTKKRISTTISTKNFNRIENLTKQTLFNANLTKTAILDIALNLLFLELEHENIEQIALKTMNFKNTE